MPRGRFPGLYPGQWDLTPSHTPRRWPREGKVLKIRRDYAVESGQVSATGTKAASLGKIIPVVALAWFHVTCGDLFRDFPRPVFKPLSVHSAFGFPVWPRSPTACRVPLRHPRAALRPEPGVQGFGAIFQFGPAALLTDFPCLCLSSL